MKTDFIEMNKFNQLRLGIIASGFQVMLTINQIVEATALEPVVVERIIKELSSN